ncbi:E3 ubiquitin-protein ligase RFWD3-like [Drosophila guanche]|uniref:Blast:E3 ubiquitin-protein ligase RFWD3 n=1 Tax=Drosophila guanche TaxID=7266 RepID=A0A3B0JWL7_DROGU|nr:E3 ubiquitin-protein ligase RFWD3-like [Drosophila guanche]SPP79890.1 blast:E3 ubiquitin-protein ligase RFWD3 [Drosophila guanche]
MESCNSANHVKDSFLAEEFEWLQKWTHLSTEIFDNEAKKCDTQQSKLLLHLDYVQKQSRNYRQQKHELISENFFLIKEINVLGDFEKQKSDLRLYISQKDQLTVERDGLLLQIEEAKAKCANLRQQLEEQGKTMQEMNNAFQSELSECEIHRTEALDALEREDEKHLREMDRLEQNLQNKYSELNTCTICKRPWDSVGVHRLVSLRCGHVFGDACIREHLRYRNFCSVCNRNASFEELRYIYGRNVLPFET